jgi:hypothetical protein
MSGVSETRTIDALLTTTLANYRNKLVDNIFDTFPLLSWLNGQLGQSMRGDSRKRVISGGESIVEQLLYETNSTAGSYSGAEVLDTTLQDGMTIARYNWKQYAASIGITGLEKRSNQSDEQLINLLEAKVNQSTMSLRDQLSQGAWSDGTGNSSKDLTGIQALVSATASVGGLAPGTYDWWKSTITSSGSFAAQGLSDMRSTYNTITFGNDKPDAIFTTQAVFEAYEASLQPQERYQNTTVANSGFANLTFKGIPVLFDRDCPSGSMYFLNSKYINLVVHRDADMTTGPFVTPNDQDVSTAQILFQGNMTVNNRRMHGAMTGITA